MSSESKICIENTQIVILAGGLGTRLRPITETITKVMIEVNGKPFLEHQFDYFKQFGFKKFLLLVSYLGMQVEKHFKDGGKIGININYSYEKKPIGTGGALKIAKNLIEDKFILIFGDTFYPLDFNELLLKAQEINKGGMLVVYDNNEKIVSNNIKVESDLFVSKYSKSNNSSDMNGVDGGVSFFFKQVLDLIPEGENVSFEENVYPILIKDRLLRAYYTNTRFYDIGTFERLNIIRNLIR